MITKAIFAINFRQFKYCPSGMRIIPATRSLVTASESSGVNVSFLAPLYPSESGLIHKHIVKYIVKLAASRSQMQLSIHGPASDTPTSHTLAERAQGSHPVAPQAGPLVIKGVAVPSSSHPTGKGRSNLKPRGARVCGHLTWCLRALASAPTTAPRRCRPGVVTECQSVALIGWLMV
jgi:hypothetical protein